MIKETGYFQYRVQFYCLNKNYKCKTIHTRIMRAANILQASSIAYMDAIALGCFGVVHFTLQRINFGKSWGCKYESNQYVFRTKEYQDPNFYPIAESNR